eukprot:GSMAST32.ASY1.ANO1.2018.1 assembled CDS
MGAAASIEAPYESVEAALAAGKTQEEVDQWVSDNKAPAAVGVGEVKPAEDSKPAATTASDEIDRSEIERNANGSEEPSSVDPELWNVDNTEVDILVKYKMGGQMWYVQSRMRENTSKKPPMPIPGFPMNKKAVDAKRYYSKEGEGEFNKDSTNFSDAKGWKEIEAANPPVAASEN